MVDFISDSSLVFSLMNGPAQWTDFGSGYQGGSYDTYRA